MAEYKGFDASEKKKKKALEEGNTFKVPYFNQILYFSFLILSTYICITINYESNVLLGSILIQGEIPYYYYYSGTGTIEALPQ